MNGRGFSLMFFLAVLVTWPGCAPTSPLYEIATVPVVGGLKVIERKRMVRYEKETIEKSPNVKAVSRITNFKGEKDAYFPNVSPDGEDIVFEIREPATGSYAPAYNLWCVKATGGHSTRRLTDSASLNIRGAWSPDGERLFFASNRIGDRSHLWRINVKKPGGITQVTSSTTWDSEPSISPDGDQVTFSAVDPRKGLPEIWIVKTDGTMPTQILEGDEPDWSPLGPIAYIVMDTTSDEHYLWTMAPDGSGRTQLTTSEPGVAGIEDRSPSWSPDGTWLAFASNRGKDRKGRRNFDIWVIRPDGTDLTQLTTNGSHDTAPTWGPNGDYIYFQSNRGGNWDIWRMGVLLPE